MNEPTIWRLHLKTKGKAFSSHQNNTTYDYFKLYQFCRENGIIGLGWSAFSKRIEKKDELQKIVKEPKAFKAINAIRQIKIGDLIWTRSSKQVYYLCKVTKPWKETQPNANHMEYDIANYVNVDWLEIGTEDKVPGKVVASFRPNRTLQRVNNSNLITKHIWNKFSGVETYSTTTKKESESIWNLLHSEQIEELFLLYLQICKELKVYTSTVKPSEPRYECIMVNSKGQLFYPQVKSGKNQLYAEEYRDIVERDSSAEVYLFATSQQYGSYQHERIHCVNTETLDEFNKKHKEILPAITREWLSLHDRLMQKT